MKKRSSATLSIRHSFCAGSAESPNIPSMPCFLPLRSGSACYRDNIFPALCLANWIIPKAQLKSRFLHIHSHCLLVDHWSPAVFPSHWAQLLTSLHSWFNPVEIQRTPSLFTFKEADSFHIFPFPRTYYQNSHNRFQDDLDAKSTGTLGFSGSMAWVWCALSEAQPHFFRESSLCLLHTLCRKTCQVTHITQTLPTSCINVMSWSGSQGSLCPLDMNTSRMRTMAHPFWWTSCLVQSTAEQSKLFSKQKSLLNE